MSSKTRSRLILASLSAVALMALGAWAALPSEPASELGGVVSDFERASARERQRQGALAFYGQAFAGYTAVNLALEGSLPPGEASEDIDRLLALMTAPAAQRGFRERGARPAPALPTSVAYRGHLALLLEGRALVRRLDGSGRERQRALLAELAQDVLQRPRHLLPSYGERIWPADNEVLRAALLLAEKRSPRDAQVAAAEHALSAALAALESSGGGEQLPTSELTPTSPLPPPRGCALAWTVAMRGLSANATAPAVYGRFRSEFGVQEGPFLVFREWPRDHPGPADEDSGPIFDGVGTSATGLALAAAKLAGSSADARNLETLSQLAAPLTATLTSGQRAAGRALLLFGRTARPWI